MNSVDKIFYISPAMNADSFDNILIRYFTHEDLILMEQLEKMCFPSKQAFSQAILRNFIYNYNSITLCVTHGKEDFLGFLIFSEVKSRVWELITIDIQSSVQGKGLGYKLLAEGIKNIEKHEPKRIILHVSITNDIAIKLYLKFGFNIVKRIRNYYNDGKYAYLMHKEYVND